MDWCSELLAPLKLFSVLVFEIYSTVQGGKHICWEYPLEHSQPLERLTHRETRMALFQHLSSPRLCLLVLEGICIKTKAVLPCKFKLKSCLANRKQESTWKFVLLLQSHGETVFAQILIPSKTTKETQGHRHKSIIYCISVMLYTAPIPCYDIIWILKTPCKEALAKSRTSVTGYTQNEHELLI